MNERDMSSYEPTREDVLIGRVSDGEATPNDWAELERLAAEDDGVWSRLASAQRAHARLSEVVDDEIAVCELVGLPKAPSRVGSIIAKGIGLAGWGVAAALALSVLTGERALESMTETGSGGGAPVMGTVTPVSFDDALDSAFDTGKAQGRVLGELPSKMVDTRGLGEGHGHEVVILRSFLERKHVGGIEVIGEQQTDTGETVRVRQHVPDYVTGQPI